MTSESQWFAVRSIFRHEVTGPKANFEERIVLYLAANADDAFNKAVQDTKKYLELNPNFVQIEHVGVYGLGHGRGELNGVEIWSHLSEGPIDPDEFYRQK